MPLNEFELIANYFKRQPSHSSIIKGVGDDCAIVELDQQFQLVMSMDTLVSGRHFPESASPEQVASRSFCTCLSDLAAMGATPRWFTLALTLPESNQSWLEKFSQSLFAIADEFACELIGGDTTQGPLVITLQVHGIVEKNKSLTRDAAKNGDSIFVTGCLGDGAAALSLLVDNKKAKSVNGCDLDYLMSRFYRPEPQIESGKKVVPYAGAAIDISDGLLADLQHMATASCIDIDIDVSAIPISEACKKIAGNDHNALHYALTGGDDYQLAFTVSKDNVPAIEKLIEDEMITATMIGVATDCLSDSPQVRCFKNKKEIFINDKKGYQHFAS